MNRKQFLERAASCCVACVATGSVASAATADTPAEKTATPPPPAPSPLQREKDFTDNWLTDLIDTIDGECDEGTKVKLIEGCGRGCYRRHKFKQDIAAAAGGTVEGFLAAARKTFEAWEESGDIHIRFGEVSRKCYCPVLRGRPGRDNDLHCHCTKATIQCIVENGLKRKAKMEIVETVRRGGKTCHFIAHLS